MKLKRYEINNLNDLLSSEGFNTSLMETNSAMKVVILKMKVSDEASFIEKTRKEFIQSNTPKRLKELSEKEDSSRTDEEKAEFMELTKKLNNKFIPAFTDFLNEEIEFDFEKISTNDFKKLMESNNSNTNKIDLNHFSIIYKYIVDAETKEEVEK